MHLDLYKRLKYYRDENITGSIISDLLRAVLDLSDEVDRLLNRIEELEE